MIPEMGKIYMPSMRTPLVFYDFEDEYLSEATHKAFHHLLEGCGWEGECYKCSANEEDI